MSIPTAGQAEPQFTSALMSKPDRLVGAALYAGTKYMELLRLPITASQPALTLPFPNEQVSLAKVVKAGLL